MSKYSEIKKEIKRLSDLQRELKPQRKLVFNGNRTSTNPIFEIQKNKYELRHLFQAYAILKGKRRTLVEKPSNFNGLILDQKRVLDYVEQYNIKEVV